MNAPLINDVIEALIEMREKYGDHIRITLAREEDADVHLTGDLGAKIHFNGEVRR